MAEFIDCADCNRGGNGTDKENLCPAGWKITKRGKGGCFCGVKRLKTNSEQGGGLKDEGV